MKGTSRFIKEKLKLFYIDVKVWSECYLEIPFEISISSLIIVSFLDHLSSLLVFTVFLPNMILLSKCTVIFRISYIVCFQSEVHLIVRNKSYD